MSRDPKRTPRAKTAGGGRTPLVLWIAAAVVVALRIVAAGTLQDVPVLGAPVLEDASYLEEVRRRESVQEVEPRLERGVPAYAPTVATVPGLVEGDLGGLAVVQAITEGIAVLVLALWISRRWGLWPALLGALLYALDPVGALFTARLHPASFALLFFALSLILLEPEDRSWHRGPLGALLFGAAAGVGFLYAPLLFVLLASLGAYLRWKDSGTAKAPATTAAAHLPRLGASALCLLPLAVLAGFVILSNAAKRDGGPALSWGAAVTVYHATRMETGGTARFLEPPQWRTESLYRSETWESLAREGDSFDLHRFYLGRGLQHLVERPVEVVGVLLVKAAATLGAPPLPDFGPSPTFALAEAGGPFAAGRWTFAVFLGIGLAGWYRTPRNGARRRLLLGIAVVGASCLLGTTSAAARQPAVLLLAFGGGAFVASLAGRLPGATRGIVALALAPAVALVSIAAGQLSPTAALLNPSEELRLAGTNRMADAPREAVPLLERAVQADPKNVDARVMLARAYQRDGLVDAATRELRAAFDTDSTHAGTLLGLATVEQTEGNMGRAVELVSRLVAQHPNNPLYLNEAARMLLQAGRWDAAKPLLLRALEIKPDYRTAQTNLEAVTQLERQAERSIIPEEMRLPSDDPLNATLTTIGVAMQRNELAVADSLIAIAERERPDHVLPFWMRAALLARSGDLPGAVAALERCDRMAPCRPAIVGQLGQMYVQAGREAEAKRLIERCLDSPPDEALRPELERLRTALFGS